MTDIDLSDRTTRCVACGHERLWHVQLGVATTDCSAFVGTDDCRCPAFEPPVPEPYDGLRLVTDEPQHLVTAEWLAEVTAERDEARAEVERLRALVSAKESWIDGAKVDLDGYDEARAVIARVRELHQQYRPAHRDDTDICTECSQYPVDVPWPCATIRALDGAS